MVPMKSSNVAFTPWRHRLGLWATLTALALSFGLVSCIPLPRCLSLSPLEGAASYDWMLNDRHYSEPLNTWVKNERLERFLLKTFRSGGVGALRSQFGFDCAQPVVVPACGDCFVCRASLSKQVAQEEDAATINLCRESGEMLMQVDIGPGRAAFSVMTYWKRPPLRADAGKF